jgi:hypothetical protein
MPNLMYHRDGYATASGTSMGMDFIASGSTQRIGTSDIEYIDLIEDPSFISTANTTPSNTLTVNRTLACSGQISGKILSCAGKVHTDGTKAVLSPSSLADCVCSVSSNVYQIRFGTSHPVGANLCFTSIWTRCCSYCVEFNCAYCDWFPSCALFYISFVGNISSSTIFLHCSLLRIIYFISPKRLPTNTKTKNYVFKHS